MRVDDIAALEVATFLSDEELTYPSYLALDELLACSIRGLSPSTPMSFSSSLCTGE